MKNNPELQLAWDFVNATNRTVFLTGKAGTGKTTFLHRLKNESLKRMVVVAPTGVAAINARGVTIHSFFQMPFGPILPTDNLNDFSGFSRKFNKTKINIIKSLDLLVIDEISMVRADLLDGIDKTLRRFRNKNKVFGGVQLVLIGDLQQLSPVVKDHEWQLLQPFYKTPFFFSSQAFQKCDAITVELKHIYRQENPLFIKILNEIRNNELTHDSADELNKRYQPNFVPQMSDGYISLTTHNTKASNINKMELQKLSGASKSYSATLEGNFPEYAYPNKEVLELKVGAQVMFIKNDSSPEKRYYNGKIGKIIELYDDEIIVNCVEDEFNIRTKPEIWENIKYTINSETKAISEDKIGSYTQMPLRLAWAITIHKSQGLTFEKAIIDAEGAFAHGQTYVALSRCKSLEGLVLKSKITPYQIIKDSNVHAFNKNAEANPPNEAILDQSKRAFQLDLISEVFDFHSFLYPVNRILDIYYKNKGSIEGVIDKPLLSLKEALANLVKISHSFSAQLKSITGSKTIPESAPLLQERFIKAIAYFDEQTKSIIRASINDMAYTTDNKTIEKDIDKQLDTLEQLVETKLLYFTGLKEGFNVQRLMELRAESVFLAKDKPKKQRKAVIEGTTNLELFELLRLLRNEIAQREGLIHYQIFTQKSLYAICEMLPTTKQELKTIHGMGKTRIEKYGAEILKVIVDYCNEHDLDITNDVSVYQELKPKKPKGDTKKISLNLFKAGKSIDQIAFERELNSNTIFGHLASFIASGEVKITDLMSKSNYSELKNIIPTKTFENLSDLKHQLDDKYSYAEIKLVLDDISKH